MSGVVSSSTIVPVATSAVGLMVAPMAAVIVATTVSLDSSMLSTTGSATKLTLNCPAGIVTWRVAPALSPVTA